MQRIEQQLHQAVAAHLRQRGRPGVVWWHSNNNIAARGRKAAILGGIAKSMGVRAGVSDLVMLHDGKFFALEIKSPGGRPSAAQLEFIADVEAAGGFTCIAEGLDEALKAIEAWGLVRGVAA